MNSPTLLGAAALVLGVVVVVWVYLIRTNISRWFRWPLAVIAVVACYTMVSLNSKLASQARMTADAVRWWENSTLTIVTVLVVVLPLMHALHERHERRGARQLKRSHAHVQAHR